MPDDTMKQTLGGYLAMAGQVTGKKLGIPALAKTARGRQAQVRSGQVQFTALPAHLEPSTGRSEQLAALSGAYGQKWEAQQVKGIKQSRIAVHLGKIERATKAAQRLQDYVWGKPILNEKGETTGYEPALVGAAGGTWEGDLGQKRQAYLQTLEAKRLRLIRQLQEETGWSIDEIIAFARKEDAGLTWQEKHKQDIIDRENEYNAMSSDPTITGEALADYAAHTRELYEKWMHEPRSFTLPDWELEQWYLTPEEKYDRLNQFKQKIDKAEYTMWKIASLSAIVQMTPQEYGDFMGYYDTWLHARNSKEAWTMDIADMLQNTKYGDLIFNPISPMPLSVLIDSGVVDEGQTLDRWEANRLGYIVPEGSHLQIGYSPDPEHPGIQALLLNPDGTTQVLNEADFRLRDFTVPQMMTAAEMEAYGFSFSLQEGETTDGWIFQVQKNAETGAVEIITQTSPQGYTYNVLEKTVTTPDGEMFTDDEWVAMIDEAQKAQEAADNAAVEALQGSSMGPVWRKFTDPASWVDKGASESYGENGEVVSRSYGSTGQGLISFDTVTGAVNVYAGGVGIDVENLPEGYTLTSDNLGNVLMQKTVGGEIISSERIDVPVPYDDANLPDFISKDANGNYQIDVTTKDGFLHLAVFYPYTYFGILKQMRNPDIEAWLMDSVENGGMGWSVEETLNFFTIAPAQFTVPSNEINYGWGSLNIIPQAWIGGIENLSTVGNNPALKWIANRFTGAMETIRTSPVTSAFLYGWGQEPSSGERQTVEDIKNFFNSMATSPLAASELFVGAAASKFGLDHDLESQKWWQDVSAALDQPAIGTNIAQDISDAFLSRQDIPSSVKTIVQILDPAWLALGVIPVFGVSVILARIPMISAATKAVGEAYTLGKTAVTASRIWGTAPAIYSEGHMMYEAFRRGWSVFRLNPTDVGDAELLSQGFKYYIWTDKKTVLIKSLDEAYNVFRTGFADGVSAVGMDYMRVGSYVTLPDGKKLIVWQAPEDAEIFNILLENHPGRGLDSWWAKLRGKAPLGQLTYAKISHPTMEALERGEISFEQVLQYAKLEMRYFEQLGESAATMNVGQLLSICDPRKSLRIEEGNIVKGIERIIEGNPKGKSIAWNDVFEFHDFYVFTDNRIHDWIRAVNGLTDALYNMAKKEGVEIRKIDYQEAVVNAHFYPRGGVMDVKGLKKFRPSYSGMKGRAFFEKERMFEDMEEGLALGYRYRDPVDALKSYISGIYRRIGQERAARIMGKEGFEEAVVGPEGIKVVTKPGLIKLLGKETEVGEALIYKTLNATKVRDNARKLKTLIDKGRGTRLNQRERNFLKTNYPELAPRIRKGMSDSIYGELKAKATMIERDAQKILSETKGEKASVMEMARHVGLTEGFENIPAIANRIFNDIKKDGITISGKEIKQAAEKKFSSQVNPILRFMYKLTRGIVTTQSGPDFSVMFIQLPFALGHDLIQNIIAIATMNPEKISTVWFQRAAMQLAIIVNPKTVTWFRNKHLLTYEKYMAYGLQLAGDTSDFYEGLGFVNTLVGREPLIGAALEKFGYRISELRNAAKVVTGFEEKWGTVPLIGRAIEEIYGRFGFAFGATGEMARIQMIESLESSWLMAGGSRGSLVEFANILTGSMSKKLAGVGATQQAVEGITLYASGYLRSNLMLFNRMMPGIPGLSGRGARGLTGRMAREYFAGTAAAWMLAYAAICEATGNEIKIKPWPKKYGGDGAEAFTINSLFGHDIGANIGMPGFLPSATRMILSTYMAATNDDIVLRLDHESLLQNFPPYKWLVSKNSPFVSLITELATGKDFIGNNLTTTSDYLDEVANLFLTFAFQSLITQDPPAGGWQFGAEVFGLRSFPESEWDKFYTMTEDIIQAIPYSFLTDDQYDKKAKGLLQWSDLNKWQQENLKFTNSDLQAKYDAAVLASQKRESLQETTYRVEKDSLELVRDTSENTATTSLQNAVDTTIGDIRAWREQLGTIKDTYFVGKAELDKIFKSLLDEWEAQRQKGEDDAPNFDRAYEEWFNIYNDETVDIQGNIVWDNVQANKQAWIDKWGEKFYQMILDLQEYGQANRNPLVRQLFRDRMTLEQYWSLGSENQTRETDAQIQLRRNNIDIDALLVFWGYKTTMINPNTEALVREWCKTWNIPESKIPALVKLVIPDDMVAQYNIEDPMAMRVYADLPDTGYDRQRYLQDNPGFYEYWLKELNHEEVNFHQVPSIQEEAWIAEYEALSDDPDVRILWRHENPAADAAMVRLGIFSRHIGTRGDELLLLLNAKKEDLTDEERRYIESIEAQRGLAEILEPSAGPPAIELPEVTLPGIGLP